MTDRITAKLGNTTLTAASDTSLSRTTPQKLITWENAAGPANIAGAVPVAYAGRNGFVVELDSTITDPTTGQNLVSWAENELTEGNWDIEARLSLGGVVSGVRWVEYIVTSLYVPPTGEPVVTAAGTVTLSGTGPVTATFAAPTYTGTEPITVALNTGALSVTGSDGNGTATINRTALVQNFTAVWTLDGPVGDPVVTAAVPFSVDAYTVPAAMVASVPVVLSATAIRFPRPEAPFDGGTAILSYGFYHSVNGTPQAVQNDVGAQVDLTGLTAGDVAVGEFRAVNAAGESLPGATATATTTISAPASMAAPTATTITSSSILFTRAAAPNNGGTAITSYNAYYTINGGATVPVTGIGETFTVSGLAPGDDLLVETRAVNAIDEGAAGAILAASSLPVAPTASLAPTMTPTGATTMDVTLAADQPDGGTAITDRTLSYTINGGAAVTVTGLAAGAVHTITGLIAGDTVVARTDVTNAAGTTAGATATAQTWQLPAAPLAGTLASPDPGAVVYTWPATPNLFGRDLIREDYILYDETDTQIGSGQRSGGAATTTISATAGVGRYVRSNAVTDAGDGPYSPASNAVTVAASIASVLTSINADGWLATYPSPPAEIDELEFDVSGPGFLPDGSAATNTRTNYLGKRFRALQSLTPLPETVTLRDDVYIGEVIPGVTNNSALPVPLPQMMWGHIEWQEVTSTFTARLFVYHEMGRNGKPVACVELSVTDGTTTTPVQRLTDMVKITDAQNGIPYAVYEATFDVSGLSDGILTVDGTVKPWFGSAFTISTDGETYPTQQGITVSKIYKGAPAYFAWVDQTSDGVGAAINTTSAGAELTPYNNAAAAISAMRIANGNNLSGCKLILLDDQTHELGTQVNLNVGDNPMRYEGSGTGTARAKIARSGTGTGVSEKRAYYKNLHAVQLTANRVFVGSRADLEANFATSYVVFDNCLLDPNGLAENTNSFVHSVGKCFAYNTVSLFNRNSERFKLNTVVVTAVGCSGFAWQYTRNFLALDNSSSIGTMDPRVNAHEGSVMAYGKFRGDAGENCFSMDAFYNGPKGLCMAMMEMVQTGGGSDDVIEFCGAGIPDAQQASTKIENLNFYGITMAGGSANGPRDNQQVIAEANRSYWQIYIRSALFPNNAMQADFNGSALVGGASGDRPHVMRQRFGTGHSDRMTYRNAIAPVFAPNSDTGDHPALNSTYVQTQAIAFVDDRSGPIGSNTGVGGDYRLVNNAALSTVPRVPSERVKLPFDLEGNAIPLDGTALAGAYTVAVTL